MRRIAMALVLLAGFMVIGLQLNQPPDEQVAADLGISIAALKYHVSVIAAEPHPTGSEANARVRDYLLAELRAIDVETEVQEGTVFAWPDHPRERLVRVQNVIGRLRGSGDGSAILLVAHYDSRAETPGAGDNAAAVAGLLEAMRLLRAMPERLNDIVVLFSDGEEIDLLGARLYTGERGLHPHPSLIDVKVVLNFDGRGNAGPGWMFETSPGNAALIRRFQKASPAPMGWSIMAAIYRIVPNRTDFTAFLEYGLNGLNFAWVGGYEHYHQPTDTPERLDPGSLAHHAVSALSLAKALVGDELGELSRKGGADLTFFSLATNIAVSYGAGAAILWFCLGFALVFIAHRRALHRGEVSAGAIIRCGLLLGLLTLVTTLIVFGAAQAILVFDHAHGAFPWRHSHHDPIYFAVLAAIGVVLTALGVARLQSAFGVAATRYAFLALLTVAAALCTVALREAAYPLTWPLIAFGIAEFIPRSRLEAARGGVVFLTAMLLLAPVLFTFAQGMMLGLCAAATPLLVIVIIPALLVDWTATPDDDE